VRGPGFEEAQVPLDHSCRLDQHHRLQATRPSSVEPSPTLSDRLREPTSTGPLPAENNQLISEGASSSSSSEARRRNRKETKETIVDKIEACRPRQSALSAKLQCLRRIWNCEQRQAKAAPDAIRSRFPVCASGHVTDPPQRWERSIDSSWTSAKPGRPDASRTTARSTGASHF
jgi:hypothetical protein